MLRILSFLIALPLLFIVLAGAGLYAAYGQVDPCRALAVERTRRTEAETGIGLERVVEPWMRAQTSQLSTGRCMRDLVHSWKTRMWNGEDHAGRDEERERDYGEEPQYRVRGYDDGRSYDDRRGYDRYDD